MQRQTRMPMQIGTQAQPRYETKAPSCDTVPEETPREALFAMQKLLEDQITCGPDPRDNGEACET